MGNLIRKIWSHRHDFRSIIYSGYVNFRYLPFKDAIKFPIILYKPKLVRLKGKIRIDCKVRYGMVRLGFNMVSLYPNSGIIIENHGGTIVFKGNCIIGNNSAISVGKSGVVIFGNNFISTTTLRLAVYDHVLFKENVLFGWDTLVIDTDFHKLTKKSGGYNRGYAPICIGANNWFGNGCKILKRTQTPDNCVFSTGTILDGKVEAPEYSVVGCVQPLAVKATGVWRNERDDKIEY